MKLDGKYALIKLQELKKPRAATIRDKILNALRLLESEGILDYGHGDNMFFVMRLRDCFVTEPLLKYADCIRSHDPEFADAVAELATQSFLHPDRKYPD